jgi:hypothetical protein
VVEPLSGAVADDKGVPAVVDYAAAVELEHLQRTIQSHYWNRENYDVFVLERIEMR